MIDPIAREAGATPRPRYGDDEFLPAPRQLGEFVLYLWRRRFPAEPAIVVQPTLPDGSIVLVSVNGGPAYVMGPETVRLEHAVAGGTEVIGVRLRPGVGARLFGDAVLELVNGGAHPGDLPGGARPRRGAWPAIDPGAADFRPLLDALAPRVASAAPDDGVAWGAAWLARNPTARVDDLCARLGWSPREVRRRFTRALGFGPKVMQRVLRFQRVLALAEGPARGVDATLGGLAAAGGYADQAHMTREFRALAGHTPGRMLRGPFDATVRPIVLPPP
jgi:AraC-like DNA-binding protein